MDRGGGGDFGAARHYVPLHQPNVITRGPLMDQHQHQHQQQRAHRTRSNPSLRGGGGADDVGGPMPPAMAMAGAVAVVGSAQQQQQHDDALKRSMYRIVTYQVREATEGLRARIEEVAGSAPSGEEVRRIAHKAGEGMLAAEARQLRGDISQVRQHIEDLSIRFEGEKHTIAEQRHLLAYLMSRQGIGGDGSGGSGGALGGGDALRRDGIAMGFSAILWRTVEYLYAIAISVLRAGNWLLQPAAWAFSSLTLFSSSGGGSDFVSFDGPDGGSFLDDGLGGGRGSPRSFFPDASGGLLPSYHNECRQKHYLLTRGFAWQDEHCAAVLSSGGLVAGGGGDGAPPTAFAPSAGARRLLAAFDTTLLGVDLAQQLYGKSLDRSVRRAAEASSRRRGGGGGGGQFMVADDDAGSLHVEGEEQMADARRQRAAQQPTIVVSAATPSSAKPPAGEGAQQKKSGLFGWFRGERAPTPEAEGSGPTKGGGGAALDVPSSHQQLSAPTPSPSLQGSPAAVSAKGQHPLGAPPAAAPALAVPMSSAQRRAMYLQQQQQQHMLQHQRRRSVSHSRSSSGIPQPPGSNLLDLLREGYLDPK